MFRTPIAFVWICLAGSAHAKLGENVTQLTKRFGKEYIVEQAESGHQYKFRSANVSADVFVKDGVSVSEMYYSDRPLNSKGEPPNEIVQAILRTNVPHGRWIETKTEGYQADYALRSSDGNYVAFISYSRPQPENAIWTMVVARNDAVRLKEPAVSSPAPPEFGLFGHRLERHGGEYREPTPDGGYLRWHLEKVRGKDTWMPFDYVPPPRGERA